MPGVKTIRSYSMFGFSTIYVIFKEDVEFYWSRTRVLEKLNSLPAGTLPEGVQPALGPDATALGQIFWYTLEGRDPDGQPAGGWDLDELRTIQDWYVRYSLLSAEGVSEVASVGGFVQEYQIDVDPDAMRAARRHASTRSSRPSGSRTSTSAPGRIEINRVEYVIRGLGLHRRSRGHREQRRRGQRQRADLRQGRGQGDARARPCGAARWTRAAPRRSAAWSSCATATTRWRPSRTSRRRSTRSRRACPAKAVIDYRQVTRDEVVAYAEAHGFDAFDGE